MTDNKHEKPKFKQNPMKPSQAPQEKAGTHEVKPAAPGTKSSQG
ncbi:MAG: hypothetical protein U9P68_05190 [Pseudomonadota bacterium]|nr:hypothetical protein [Pseudomonadota bacterium]